MVSRKYTSDYRLENVVDPRTGRLRTRPVYRGEYYRFRAAPAAVRGTKRLYLLASLLCTACFLAPLFSNAPSGHAMYVMLPFAALVFPVFYLLAGCRRLVAAKERVTREHRDKITDRLRGASLSACILSGISAAGHVVYWILNGSSLCDALFLLAAAVIFALSLVMFCQRARLEMEPCGPAQKSAADARSAEA